MIIKEIKKLEKLKHQRAKLLDAAGKSLAVAIGKLLVEELGNLEKSDRDYVLTSPAVLAALGKCAASPETMVTPKAKRGPKPKAVQTEATIGEAAPAAPVKAKGKRGRTSKVTDEELISFIAAKPSKIGDLKKQFGQLIPKRLKQLEAANKIKCVPSGVMKIYHAL